MTRQPPKVFTERPGPISPPTVDPLKFCVATTVAAIAWLITPPLAVAAFASMGIVAYSKAYRRGLLASRCFIGDTRLILVYLVVLAAGGVAGTVLRLV